MSPTVVTESGAARLSLPLIVETALGMLRAGAGDLSMRALARELGVQAPALYYYVANKRELLDVVAREAWAGLGPALLDFGAVASVEEFVEAERDFCREVRGFYGAHPGLARVMLEGAAPGRHEDDDARGRTQASGLDALTRLGLAREEALGVLEAASRWCLAAMVAEELVSEPEPRATRLFEDGLTLLLDGVRRRLEVAATAGPVGD